MSDERSERAPATSSAPARVAFIVAAALPLAVSSWRAPSAAAGGLLALFACGAAFVLYRRRGVVGWLAPAYVVVAGWLLAASLPSLVDVERALAAPIAQLRGGTPLLAVKLLSFAAVWWAVHDDERRRALRWLLAATAALVLGSVAGVLALASVAVCLACLAVPRRHAAIAWLAERGLAKLPAAPLVALAFALVAVVAGSRVPAPGGRAATSDPVVETRFWMDEIDNAPRAAYWARRWAAQETAAPGEGSLRLALLALRLGELDEGRRLLADVAERGAPGEVRAHARRALSSGASE